jgi:hypothetical protein
MSKKTKAKEVDKSVKVTPEQSKDFKLRITIENSDSGFVDPEDKKLKNMEGQFAMVFILQDDPDSNGLRIQSVETGVISEHDKMNALGAIAEICKDRAYALVQSSIMEMVEKHPGIKVSRSGDPNVN